MFHPIVFRARHDRPCYVLKHLLTVSALLPAGEEDEFIREAAAESVRIHPLSLFR